MNRFHQTIQKIVFLFGFFFSHFFQFFSTFFCISFICLVVSFLPFVVDMFHYDYLYFSCLVMIQMDGWMVELNMQTVWAKKTIITLLHIQNHINTIVSIGFSIAFLILNGILLVCSAQIFIALASENDCVLQTHIHTTCIQWTWLTKNRYADLLLSKTVNGIGRRTQVKDSNIENNIKLTNGKKSHRNPPYFGYCTLTYMNNTDTKSRFWLLLFWWRRSTRPLCASYYKSYNEWLQFHISLMQINPNGSNINQCTKFNRYGFLAFCINIYTHYSLSWHTREIRFHCDYIGLNRAQERPSTKSNRYAKTHTRCPFFFFILLSFIRIYFFSHSAFRLNRK